MYGVEPALVEKLQGKLRRPGPNTAAGRLMRTKTAVHIADVRTEPGFFDTPPGFAGPQLAIHAGARTLLAVPMLKESELVGYIIIYRQEPEPFTEKHIELVHREYSAAERATRIPAATDRNIRGFASRFELAR